MILFDVPIIAPLAADARVAQKHGAEDEEEVSKVRGGEPRRRGLGPPQVLKKTVTFENQNGVGNQSRS